jgi:hypothetical protein
MRRNTVIYKQMPSTLEVSTAMKIQVEVFWIVTPCSFAVGYQLYDEDWDKTLRNVGILLQHYAVSQPRRSRLEMLHNVSLAVLYVFNKKTA